MIFLLYSAILFSTSSTANALTVIQGLVRDSISHEPLPYASILIPNTDIGVITDLNGKFRMESSKSISKIHVSMLGYKKQELVIKNGIANNFIIDMLPESNILQELIVRPGKEKYSKKNNPAVELMERIRKDYPKHNPENKTYFSYEKYEKVTLALNNFNNQIDTTGKWGFIKEFIDTSAISGNRVLPLSVRELTGVKLFKANPHCEKEIISGIHHAGIENTIDAESINKFIDDIFREVDIFQNDITIMQNRFVSPLSNIASNYYKFYLGDTIQIDEQKYTELNFVPHNPESFGFTGRIYLNESDSCITIKKVILQVPKAINLNYVDGILITQDFETALDGTRLKLNDEMMCEFCILPGTQGLYAARTCNYGNFLFEKRDDEYAQFYELQGNKFLIKGASERSKEFWQLHRNTFTKENSSVNGVEEMLSKMREIPLFYWLEKIIGTLVNGYIPTGYKSKFDIGPVNTFISTNTIEGVRFRIGGMSTANMHSNIFTRGYIAYGLKDHKLKYGAELEYSFVSKKYHSREFPINSIKLEHNYDVDHLGQHYLFTNQDNIFLSLKRTPDNKLTYRRLTKLSYKLEMLNGLTITAILKHKIQEATEYLPFENGYGQVFSHYNIPSIELSLRYAPGETFYQMRSERVPINMDAPVFMLTHEYGPCGFLSSNFTLNKTEFSIQKRFWFSAFGYTDIIVKAAKVWSKVPYPELLWPNANLSYTIQPESYPLMNAMEFAVDQQISWDMTYWGNGILFNRIPLINKLKLREVITFRGIWGDLTDKNNPAKNNTLYQFPFMSFAKPIGKIPYIEAGVGIDNILTILRVDYIWRLTYRNTPNSSKSGLRIALHFTF